MRPSDRIDDAGRARIEAAVVAAERVTSGELVVTVVRACDEYGSAGWRLGVALAALALLASGLSGARAPAGELLVAQTVALALGHALARIPAVRRLLVAESAMQRMAERRAAAAFTEHGLQRTRARTGLLILVALFERRVVVLADEGVNRRLAVGHRWDEVVDLVITGIRRGALVDGIVAGVARCAEILEEPLPADSDNPDEIRPSLVLEE